MLSLSRVLGVTGLCALLGGPFSMAPAFAQTTPLVQDAPATASQVSGLVTDATGAPIAGATIALNGAHAYEATTDPQGRYAISDVSPGLYTATVTRAGYQSGTEHDVAVVSGSPVSLNVQLATPTLTSLRTIGSSRTSFSRATFNTSPAAVTVINTQTFIDQGQFQVKDVLNQTPGIVVSLPATSGNGASPGAITFPNIRGGLSFETASLIDGHPVSVGAFGDYVSTFLNAFTLGSVEVVKGPGASSPVVNDAIGGTVNFRTLDPSRTPTGYETIGVDSFGGTFSNFGYSNTVMNGKLGFVVDYAVNGTPGPLHDYTRLAPVNAGYFVNGQAIASNPNTSPTIGGTPTRYNNLTTTAVYSGIPISTTFTDKTELVKLRYNLSSTSSFTGSYLGSQTWTEQNGNHFNQETSTFVPGANYTGAVGPQAGGITLEDNIFPPAHEWEINNEPLFQGEFRSSFRDNTILARAYTASISRLQFNGLNSPTQNALISGTVFGTLNLCPVGATVGSKGNAGKCIPAGGGAPFAPTSTAFNGQPVTFTAGGAYFSDSEEDRLRGYSFEIDHPFGDTGNLVSVSYDTTKSVTGKYNVGTYVAGCNFCGITVPPTSSQIDGTLLVRGIANIGAKTQATLSLYDDTYQTHFSNDFGATFQNQTQSHLDERLGVTYRLNQGASLRASAGSSIAPPYLLLYSSGLTPPIIDRNTQQFATNTESNPNLRPETAFGYDLGGDVRLTRDGYTVFSGDVYRTTLWNQLISTSQFINGNVSVNTYNAGDKTGSPTGAPVTVPLYSSGPTNLAMARYDGLEFGVKRSAPVGFGFTAQGSLMHAYPINIPASFYTAAGSTVPTRNVGVVPGNNFYGRYQGVSNQPIPYSQGYGEINYATAKGTMVSFGETYYGPNNSFFVPAFFIANANWRQSLGHGISVSVNIDNLFNTLSDPFISEFQGLTQPVINGATLNGTPISGALTNANTYGPRNVRISFSKKLGAH